MPAGNPQKGELWRSNSQGDIDIAWRVEAIVASICWLFPALEGATDQPHERHRTVDVSEMQNSWTYIDPTDGDNKFAVARTLSGGVTVDSRLLRNPLSKRETCCLAAYLIAAAKVDVREIRDLVEVARNTLRG
jgi:hypothetical protein